MKTCTNKDCLHKGKPQPEENFYWNAGDGIYFGQCKECCKAKSRARNKYYKTPRQRAFINKKAEAALFREFDRLLKPHD